MRALPVLLVLLALVLGPAPSLACSCPSGGPFTEVAPEADLILVGEVLRYHENSMQVDVVQVLKGDETRKRITVWGDNGMQCRPYVDRFPVKTRWVFALFRHEEQWAKEDLDNLQKPLPEWDGKAPFYMISVCGAYWLEVQGEKVRGEIYLQAAPNQAVESVSLDELKQWLATR